MKLLVLFTFTLFSQILFSQTKVSLNDVYVEDNLVYQTTTNQLYTGLVQKVRNNGHLVYEEEYDKGIIQSSRVYYNGKDKLVSDEILFNPNKPFTYSKKLRYDTQGEINRIITYDVDGSKILKEEFKNGKLIYSCEFANGKKHGMMLGYLNGSEKPTYSCKFVNGKKHGTEYCLTANGKEKIKEFNYGKRID